MEQILSATAEPKLPARLSAVRHGLRSREIVIPGLEDAADWDAFHDDAIESLDPLGAVQYALAERAADTARELGPESYYGSAYAEVAARPMPEFEHDPYPRIDLLTAISKYEARLNRQLLHTLHELQALQDRRAGRDAPLARIDLTGADDD